MLEAVLISKGALSRACNSSGNQSFEKNEFTLGVFVDLSKAFDTVYHQILLKIRILQYSWG